MSRMFCLKWHLCVAGLVLAGCGSQGVPSKRPLFVLQRKIYHYGAA